jgi:hypothetical protein
MNSSRVVLMLITLRQVETIILLDACEVPFYTYAAITP